MVVVDGAETNPIEENRLFQLRQQAIPMVERWTDTELVASHDGYAPVIHRRRFALDPAAGRLEIADELLGDGAHDVETLLHLATGTTVEIRNDRQAELARDGVRVTLELTGGAGVLELRDGWVSERFGVREPAPVLAARVKGVPETFGWSIATAAVPANPDPRALARSAS